MCKDIHLLYSVELVTLDYLCVTIEVLYLVKVPGYEREPLKTPRR